jgi:hypothetical protein
VKHSFNRIATWVGYAIVLGGLPLVAWEYPVVTVSIVVGTALAILILTALYDYDHWKQIFVRWRARDVLRDAATIVTPHLDRLAQEMGGILEWDGRSDYLWQPWIDRSRDFIDVTVVPSLSQEQQRVVEDWDPILREEIRSQASGRVFERAQSLGLVT